MTIPTIFDWLERLEPWRGFPAAYVVLGAAIVILVARDWRLTLFALLAQVLATSLLFVDVLDPRLAVVKLLTGLFICLILYITARQVRWGELPEDVSPVEAVQLQAERQIRLGPYLLPTSAPFRLLLALLLALVVWTVSQQPGFRLPAITQGHLTLGVYALVLFGLMQVSLTAEPLKAGLGLLMVMAGFELFYHALEQSVLMLAALAATNLVLALAISYLTQVRHSPEAIFHPGEGSR